MSRQILELDDATQMREFGRFEIGQGCLNDTERLAYSRIAGIRAKYLLFDCISELGWNLDYIGCVGLEAGAHFIFSS